jgi:hypothetical protein
MQKRGGYFQLLRRRGFWLVYEECTQYTTQRIKDAVYGDGLSDGRWDSGCRMNTWN